jgi:hypothetical protein
MISVEIQEGMAVKTKLFFSITVAVMILSALIGCDNSQRLSCPQSDESTMGVLRSNDHGVTWTSLGNACITELGEHPADPTGFVMNDEVVLYFVDFGHLNQNYPQTLYRITSSDGINFGKPQPAYTQSATMVDPFVLPLTNGAYRFFIPSTDEGIISGTSPDGKGFNQDPGIRIPMGGGGMPGALQLPDGKVRLFVNGAIHGEGGIFSYISVDGLNFNEEKGLRIAGTPGMVYDDAQPIRLKNGSYLMMYQIHPDNMTDKPEPWTFTEIHIATSVDGFTWAPNPKVIGYGGTSCIVEWADGALLIYYGH